MVAYVAFVSNPRSTHAKSTAGLLQERVRRELKEWSAVDCGAGLRLYHLPSFGRDAESLVLPNRSGVILGTLFTQTLFGATAAIRPAIDQDTTDRIVESRGEHLTKSYWGNYVAFLCDARLETHYIIRDCSGAVPCYALIHEEVTIVTSSINLLRCLGLPRFSLNRDYIVGFMMEPELAHPSCAINEVEEILAGQCLVLSNVKSHRTTLWDPRQICTENTLEDFDEASQRVREVTQACVDLWSSRFDRLVHLLSGGLDSSVVLACLRNSTHRPAVTCVHRDYGGRDSQELQFARLAAGDFDLTVQWNYGRDLRYGEQILGFPKSPKPSVSGLALGVEATLRNLIPESTRAQAVWDGQGGDHLFFDSRAPFEAVDYAFSHGIIHDFAFHVRGAVRQSRLSYWGVISRSLKQGLFRSAWHPGTDRPRSLPFLTREIAEGTNLNYVWQPWLSTSKRIPPGKQLQICILAWLLHRHVPIPELEYAPGHHPLFSQPLLELCLRIPIFTLVRGGINRSLERAAFRHYIPRQILARENKAAIAISHMHQVRSSMPFLRDLFLDGVLVRERILDRTSLEPYLMGNRPLDHRVLWPFLSALAAEVWARKWVASDWRI